MESLEGDELHGRCQCQSVGKKKKTAEQRSARKTAQQTGREQAATKESPTKHKASVLRDTDEGMSEDTRLAVRAFKGQGQEQGQFIRGGGRGQAGVGRPRPPSYCATPPPTTPASRPLPVLPTWASGKVVGFVAVGRSGGQCSCVEAAPGLLLLLLEEDENSNWC